jgi:hypothetical protein
MCRLSCRHIYSIYAAHLLRTWYLDSATRMNPNVNFDQSIPGRTEGRCDGIIEIRDEYQVSDVAMLIQPSGRVVLRKL